MKSNQVHLLSIKELDETIMDLGERIEALSYFITEGEGLDGKTTKELMESRSDFFAAQSNLYKAREHIVKNS